MQELLDKYEIVVGLEVHVQLLTESKIVTSDANFFQQKPNKRETSRKKDQIPLCSRMTVYFRKIRGLFKNTYDRL